MASPVTRPVTLAAATDADLVPDLGAGRGPRWLDRYLAAELPALIRLRRQVHGNPELARTESATTALIMSRLTDAGIPAEMLPGGTGVVAEIGAGADGAAADVGPVVALRADIDALPLTENTGLPFSSTVPGVAHACGHDVHLTALLGAALALQRAGTLPGRIRVIFQPAEEVMPGGAKDVVAAGVLDGVSRAFALHCDPRVRVGQVGLKVGAITSTADLVEVRLSGPGGHTSRPHLTADLVQAIGTVITGLPLLISRRLDPRSSPVMVWGAVHAGEAANAIPQEGVLRGTLRLTNREAWESAAGLVEELVRDLLAPTGVSYRLVHVRGVPPVENDEESVGFLRHGVARALGSAAAVSTEQSTGAEDFAEMLEQVPGALARLGVWDGVGPQPDLHSPHFIADERAIAVGVRVLVHTALAALAGA